MKLELRNVKVAESLSEETTAYTATLYVDGKPTVDCSNHGQGGPDMYHPIKGDRESLDAVEKALGGPGGMESKIGDLLTAWMEERDAKRFKARLEKKGYPFTARARVLDFTIEAFKGHDGTEWPSSEVLSTAYAAFRTKAGADAWVADGARKEFGDKFRSAEVY